MPCKLQKNYPGRDVKEITKNDELFRLISAETVKGKYSISAKVNDIFVLKSLYDLNSDIVWNECIDIVLEYRLLMAKMVEAGVSPKSATSKAKKEAIDKVQARYIDELGKAKYLEIFPMVDKKSAKTTKQRSKTQVREVKSKISEIKKLTKDLELPPEVTKPNEDVVSQINNVIKDDESLKALEDTRDIEALKEEKAKIELPNVDLDIDIFANDTKDKEEVEKDEDTNWVEVGTNSDEVLPKVEDLKPIEEVEQFEQFEEEYEEEFENLEDFFLSVDDDLF